MFLILFQFLSFGNSFLYYHISLYGGLILFCCYIIYDTQTIIRNVQNVGIQNADYINDAIHLYIDFIAIFVRILILIAKSKQNSNHERNQNHSYRPVPLRSIKTEL